MDILKRFLNYRGIEDYTKLEPEEKETFKKWKVILSQGDDIKVEDFKNFLQSQIDIIEMRWRDLTIENSKKAELIPYHTVYKTLEQVINAPMVEREQLEASLNQLINNNA